MTNTELSKFSKNYWQPGDQKNKVVGVCLISVVTLFQNTGVTVISGRSQIHICKGESRVPEVHYSYAIQKLKK